MTTVDEAIRSLKTRRWMMAVGLLAGLALAALNAKPLVDGVARDWLDVGIVVVWGFVALSGGAGYWMLSRQIARLERTRGQL